MPIAVPQRFLSIGLFLALVMGLHFASAADFQVFFGTYTNGSSRGIYSCRYNDHAGTFGAVHLAAESANPSFLAIHGNGRFLFAVNETNEYEGKASGAVSSFRIKEGGALERINQVPTGGSAPCHLTLDRNGRFLLIANYNGGNVSAIAIGSDGRLGEMTEKIQHLGKSVNRHRQSAPHAHSINLDPQGRFAAAADLGVDKVFVYPFDSRSGRVSLRGAQSLSLAPGAGPRHLAFHPTQPLAFVNNELHSTLSSLAFDPSTGKLNLIETRSTLPNDYSGGNSTAETQVHPNGRYVYVSNRGHDSIAVFQVEPNRGSITLLENEPTGGRTPRNFSLDPSGKFLLAANQSSDAVTLFRVNPSSGLLSATGTSLEVPTPVCIRFLRL